MRCPNWKVGWIGSPSSYHSIQLLLCLRSQVMVELGKLALEEEEG